MRDDPTGPFYVAKVKLLFEKTVTLHYYGCTSIALQTAFFKPCWHMVAGDDIVLQWECPDWDDDGRPNFVAYFGTIDLRDIQIFTPCWSPASWNSPRPASFAINQFALWHRFMISYFDLNVRIDLIKPAHNTSFCSPFFAILGGCYHAFWKPAAGIH